MVAGAAPGCNVFAPAITGWPKAPMGTPPTSLTVEHDDAMWWSSVTGGVPSEHVEWLE